MKKIKLALTALILFAALAFLQPMPANADLLASVPPAMVFVKNKEDEMLLKHNFEADNGIYIPWDTSIDEGFFM